jgi:hypothetical protein
MLVDRRLPWPADASRDVALQSLVGHMASSSTERTRVQLVMPTRHEGIEVALYRRPVGPFVGYQRASSVGCAESVRDRAVKLFESDESAFAAPALTEILVCTHGTRDVCCGSLGTAVFGQLSEMYAWSSAHRVRRTTHLGGHRFAPTVLLLPSGTVWAWVTAELMQDIIEQVAPVATAVEHFRGAMGMPQPEVQAVDAALFAGFGWSWLSRPRTGTVVERCGPETSVRIDHITDDRQWVSTATVRTASLLPVPTCGVPLDGSESTQAQWTVTSLSTTEF